MSDGGRLATAATTGPQWGLSYLYDGFGNRLQQNVAKAWAGYTPPSSNLLVDPATNRVNSWGYDANGNATSTPGVGAVSYDWANRVSGVGGESYGYDPGNKRLWKNSVLTLWSGGRVGTFDLLFASHWTGSSYAQQLRFRQLTTDRYFAGRKLRGEDRLGSVGSRFYPYGEEMAASANPADKFATYHRDGTGLDYADQRYYHAGSGRFVSSDPFYSPRALAEPGGWSRYSYVIGDPANLIDPIGWDYKVPPSGTFDPKDPRNVSGSSITVGSDFILIDYHWVSGIGFTEVRYHLPQAQRDAESGFCVDSRTGLTCGEADRRRRVEECVSGVVAEINQERESAMAAFRSLVDPEYVGPTTVGILSGAYRGAIPGGSLGVELGGPVGLGVGAFVGGVLGAGSSTLTSPLTSRGLFRLGSVMIDTYFSTITTELSSYCAVGLDPWSTFLNARQQATIF